MITLIIELAVVVIGFMAAAVLFYRIPKLPEAEAPAQSTPAVSIVIPARNEEKNLDLLLRDLTLQTLRPLEIICVDDASEDRTAEVARAYGVRVLSVKDKPEDWTGKTWACQQGAEAAGGNLLLFLDADVRLGRRGLEKLMSARRKSGGTISVQPYHRTEKNYEQLSLVFNLVQIAANGTALPRVRRGGLYGPVILISRADYITVGGHGAVRVSIVEDMALGLRLEQQGLPYDVFVGDGDIAFRMYGGGLRSLFEGWTKNLASGASKTPLHIFLLVFFLIASMTSAPYHFIAALATGSWAWVGFYGAVCLIWAAVLSGLSGKIGRFRLWATLLYPIPLLFFIGIFVLSAVKKIFRLKVRWKGRVISTEAKQCD